MGPTEEALAKSLPPWPLGYLRPRLSLPLAEHPLLTSVSELRWWQICQYNRTDPLCKPLANQKCGSCPQNILRLKSQ